MVKDREKAQVDKTDRREIERESYPSKSACCQGRLIRTTKYECLTFVHIPNLLAQLHILSEGSRGFEQSLFYFWAFHYITCCSPFIYSSNVIKHKGDERALCFNDNKCSNPSLSLLILNKRHLNSGRYCSHTGNTTKADGIRLV